MGEVIEHPAWRAMDAEDRLGRVDRIRADAMRYVYDNDPGLDEYRMNNPKFDDLDATRVYLEWREGADRALEEFRKKEGTGQ